MLEMRNVSYSYTGKGKAKVSVLENRTMKFEKGSIYALFGPSGSGKTTCLMLLGGLEIPNQGKILLDGQDISEIGYQKLRQKYVSYIFQDYMLFPYMTALENVLVSAQISLKKQDKNMVKQKATELLYSLGLVEAEVNRKVTELSGGQQQRVAIARALVTEADYILADEPTGNLDRENTVSIMELMGQIAHERNKALVIVTHSEYVRNECDHVYYIDKDMDKEGGYESCKTNIN
ncbi:MAG: ABC transporter ATP-binding protein [Lachnospiraceae bacterium]|nr:ABC transporter ATP-binding protein [Lachnospiraceae bacterium]